MSNSYLEILGEKYKPSKRMHGYLPLYARYFENRREDVKAFLEIGLQTNKSINMWAEYFPNAKIYGVDIDPANKEFETDRIKVFIGDQGDESFLDSLPNDLDIIVEGGSHHIEHMILNIEKLVPKLKDGGIYACEDMEAATAGRKPVLDYLKKLCNNVNYWPDGYRGADWPLLNTFDDSATWWDKNIIGVSFYRYITFIQKGKNPEQGEAHLRI